MDYSGEQYRQLFENAPIGIINAALDGTPLMVNERAAQAFGYESAEAFLANVRSLLDLWAYPEQRHQAAEIMLTTGVLRDHEVVMKRRDGTRVVFAVSANPFVDDSGTTIGVQVSGIEITDRVVAERRLEEAQSQASIGFWSWRIDTGEFWRTKELYRIIDVPPEVGAPLGHIQTLVHPDDRELIATTLGTFKREPGEGFEVEFRIVTDAGETRWLIARGQVDADGWEMSGSVQDISKQKAVEAKLTELNDLKTEFVGVVAHDLRSPLTVASGYAEFLAEQWDEIADPERRQLVDNVQRSLNRLGSLVADVLEVSRLEAGVGPEKLRPFDLEKLVRTAVDELTIASPFRECHVVIERVLPEVLGDRDSIWRVVTNLISNAVKYSPPDEPITVCAEQIGDVVRVGVSDRGPGISQADQSKLFQKFSRLASVDGKRPEGTGLGLFICKSLVESCGGRIWLESTVGEGSTFFFTLPIALETER